MTRANRVEGSYPVWHGHDPCPETLVIGSRGYGPLGRLVHGSTPMGLARDARSALLVLPRGPRAAPSSAPTVTAAAVAT